MNHKTQGFSVVDGIDVDIFLEFPCFFLLSSNFECWQFYLWFLFLFESSLDISKFLIHVMLKPSMQDFKPDFASMGDECSYPMVSIFFSTTLLGNWDED